MGNTGVRVVESGLDVSGPAASEDAPSCQRLNGKPTFEGSLFDIQDRRSATRCGQRRTAASATVPPERTTHFSWPIRLARLRVFDISRLRLAILTNPIYSPGLIKGLQSQA